MDEVPYYLDIRGLTRPSDDPDASGDKGEADTSPQGGAPNDSAPCRPRPWVGIRFDCCSVYTRIYRNPADSAYHGCCPRCLRRVTLRVGPNGTSARFFSAE